MRDDGEWIDGAILDDWRARDEAKNARIEALTAENAALRADECDPDGCAAHISAFASRVDALTAQLAQRDAALKAANEDVRALLREIYYRDAYMSPELKAIHDRLAAYRKARGQDETAKG